jgi:hypothetical protein
MRNNPWAGACAAAAKNLLGPSPAVDMAGFYRRFGLLAQSNHFSKLLLTKNFLFFLPL